MPVDERALRDLLEESEDLHVDAMRQTRRALAHVVEQGEERRAHGGPDPDETRAFHHQRSRALKLTGTGVGAGIGAGIGAGVGVGALVLSAIGAHAAFADSATDVASAQTAASIENLAVAVYKKAATLPFMQGIPDPAGATITAFVTRTVAQHMDHANAFNAVAAKLGGKQQSGLDMPVYTGVVTPALGTLKNPKDVVDFAAELELVAAETYAVQTAAVADMQLRATFASIMGVENQHRAILLAVSALLAANAPQLIKIGDDPSALPAAAGSVGFPDNFLPLDKARPATEGAVK